MSGGAIRRSSGGGVDDNATMSLSFSNPPPDFVCPLSNHVMVDPVVSLSTGISYESSAILSWRKERGGICPITGTGLGSLVPNTELKKQIEEWKQQIKGYRRIQRRSPTTYFLADEKLPSSSSKQSLRDLSPESEHKEKVKDEMFKKVEQILHTFTDAGISDYVSRVRSAEDKAETEPHYPTEVAALVDPNNPRYFYEVEYSSIFRHGPTMTFPRRSI